jgi:hypothetical protein
MVSQSIHAHNQSLQELKYPILSPFAEVSKEGFYDKEDFMRILVLTLCLATLVFYGHAIAGLWGYFIGKPGLFTILSGLLAGTATGTLAVVLWHRYMVKGLFNETPRDGADQDSGDS